MENVVDDAEIWRRAEGIVFGKEEGLDIRPSLVEIRCFESIVEKLQKVGEVGCRRIDRFGVLALAEVEVAEELLVAGELALDAHRGEGCQ